MEYTITSRGRPIGVTDLGFKRVGGPLRSGWFHPNAEGERLMPVIAAVYPVVCAYVRHDVHWEAGTSTAQPDPSGSTIP